MTRSLILAAVLALAFSASGASAQKLDAKGKCHDAKGHFAKMDVCKGAAPAAAGHCRDVKTKKFAKCGLPNTEAVPATK